VRCPTASGPTASRAETDDDAELTNRYKSLETLVKRLGSQTPEDRRWRAEVLDVRGHLFIQCKEHREVHGSGSKAAAKCGGKNRAVKTEVFMHADTGSMSGGERQRFTAFIMAAALSYQLGIAEQGFTTYGTVMMDEAFVLASEEFAGAGIKALHEFGFQLLLAAPENVIDLSRHLRLCHRDPARQAHQPLRRPHRSGHRPAARVRRRNRGAPRRTPWISSSADSRRAGFSGPPATRRAHRNGEPTAQNPTGMGPR
jgi:hypothetical protein